jgi:hypothetical protein
MSATDLRLETVDVGGLSMRIVSQGEGPLVLLCHVWMSPADQGLFSALR